MSPPSPNLKTPKSLCNKNQARKAMKKIPIFLTDSYHDFILDEMKRRDKIEYEREKSVVERCE